jgi:Lhr-like helicase
MINDERRYPFINAITDEMIGTVGDEFWSLRARVGLNVILRGRVWRILQIDEERGVIHALPSTDPLGAAPGWDGELNPGFQRDSGRIWADSVKVIHDAFTNMKKEELIKSLETDDGCLEEIEKRNTSPL